MAMKIVIFGSRPPIELRRGKHTDLERWYADNMPTLKQTIAASEFSIASVIEGGAQGFDRLGRYWAEDNGL